MVTVQVTTLSLIEGSRSSLEKSELASKSSSTNFICLFFLRFFGILPSESKDTVRGLPLKKMLSFRLGNAYHVTVMPSI